MQECGLSDPRMRIEIEVTARRALTAGVAAIAGGEEVRGDRGGDGAAGARRLDQHGERDVAAVGDEPGVGRRRVAAAVLGGAALAVDVAGRAGERGAGAG